MRNLRDHICILIILYINNVPIYINKALRSKHINILPLSRICCIAYTNNIVPSFSSLRMVLNFVYQTLRAIPFWHFHKKQLILYCKLAYELNQTNNIHTQAQFLRKVGVIVRCFLVFGNNHKMFHAKHCLSNLFGCCRHTRSWMFYRSG